MPSYERRLYTTRNKATENAIPMKRANPQKRLSCLHDPKT
jgi:hypothetical protein